MSEATANTLPWPLKVYIAARSEDRYLARDLRMALQAQGITCTSRWLDLDDLSPVSFSEDRALMCFEDILAAHVVLLHSERPSHRATTGGKHVETGFALAARRPIVLLGDIENVFHALPSVQRVSAMTYPPRLGEILQLAALYGTPIPAAALSAG